MDEGRDELRKGQVRNAKEMDEYEAYLYLRSESVLCNLHWADFGWWLCR